MNSSTTDYIIRQQERINSNVAYRTAKLGLIALLLTLALIGELR